jgi:3'-5' exoribonuclease
MLVNELTDGMEIDQVLLVREAERRQRRDGGEYMRLQLGDRTGAVTCMVWEELMQAQELARAGGPVHVCGRYTVHPRFGPQINLRSLDAAAPGSFDESDLRDGPAREVRQLEAEVRELLDTIREPHLRLLLEGVFGEDSELWAGYRVAPAAKHYHQA